MCMIDDCDERVIIRTDETRRARKEHRCSECRRTIAIGERYHFETYVDQPGGRYATHRTCEHCDVARDWLLAECSGFMYGGVREDLVEHLDEYPENLHLKIIGMGIRRGWRRRDGKLWRVPKLPATSEQLYRVAALARGLQNIVAERHKGFM